MKKTLILGALCAVVLLVGCKTSSVITNNADGTSTTNVVKTVDTNLVQSIAKIVSSSGSRVAVAATKRPELKADFALASQAIDTLLLSGNYDPQALRESLAKINVTADDDVWLIGSTLLDSYELLASEVVSQQLDKVVWLKPVLTGIRDGLALAAQ